MGASEEHPDLLTLDAVRAGEASPEDAAHADSCGACRTELEDLRALEKLDAPSIAIPEAIDRAVIENARRQLGRKRPKYWIPLSAAAAVLVSALVVVLALPENPRQPMAGAKPGDIDRNGVVDIVDAYTLAVRIENGEPLDPEWDITGDGVVDEADWKKIANDTVSLAERDS